MLHINLSAAIEARQWMDKSVQRNPKEWSAYFERGLYLFDLGSHEQALNDC